MKPVNPRSITDAERPWIEGWSNDAHKALFRAVRDRYTPRMALNVCSYVSTRAVGEHPAVSQTAKAEYRRILAGLAEEGVTPPRPRRRRRGGNPVVVTPLPYAGRGSSQGAGGGSVRSTPAPASASSGSDTWSALRAIAWLASNASEELDAPGHTDDFRQLRYRQILREVLDAAMVSAADSPDSPIPGYLKAAGQVADEAA